MMRAFEKMIAPYARAIRMMVGRAVVSLVDDAQPIQRVQVTILADELHGSVERIQNYGHTARPLSGSQAVTLSVCGSRDHLVVIALDDGRYRPTDLEDGESALYNHVGTRVICRADNTIEAVADKLFIASELQADIVTALGAGTGVFSVLGGKVVTVVNGSVISID